MPPHSKPLAPTDRGEKAGRLAASEMIKTLSPETGSVEGVVRRLEQVGIIVARGHQEAGMRTAEVRAWHIGFQAGMTLELGDYMRRF
jgi:N-acetylglucosamine-6-phosphate deacetylase